MAQFHLMDYRNLTREQKSSYYKWLAENADRIEELCQQKRAHCDQLSKIFDKKQVKSKESREYRRQLLMKKVEKEVEQEIVKNNMKNAKKVTHELEAKYKELNPLVQRIKKSLEIFNYNIEMKPKKLRKWYEKVHILKLQLKEVYDAKKVEVDTAKAELEASIRSHDITKEQLNAKIHEYGELVKENDKLKNMLEEMNPDEIKNDLDLKLAEKNELEEEFETKKTDKNNILEDIQDIRKSIEIVKQVIAESEAEYGKLAERNKVKSKELENANLLLYTSLSAKFKDEQSKQDQINMTEVEVLGGILNECKVLMEKGNQLEDDINAQNKEYDSLLLEKDDCLKRYEKAKKDLETLEHDWEDLPNYEKEKIDAAKGKLIQLKNEITRIKAEYIEKIHKLVSKENVNNKLIQVLNKKIPSKKNTPTVKSTRSEARARREKIIEILDMESSDDFDLIVNKKKF